MDLARALDLLAGFDRATAHLEFDRSVRGALEFVQANFRVARASVALLQEDGDGFLLFDTSRPIEGIEFGMPLPLDSASLGETVRTREAIYRPDIREWPHPNRVDQAFVRAGLLASLTVPLIVGGQCIGTLGVGGAAVDSLHPDDRALLELLAPRLAHVIKSSLAVRALTESEARFRAVFDAVSDGLLLADLRTRRLLLANPAICRLIGRDAAEIASMRVEDLSPASHLPAVINACGAALDAQRLAFDLTIDVPLLQKDGTTRLVDIGTSFTLFHGRECLVGIFRDADERKRRERELVQTEKLESIRTLAAGIAHDFNNLLTGIVGNVSLAQNQFPADHPVQLPLGEAQRASSRATGLTRQLLTFTKGGKPFRRATDLGNVIRDAASEVVLGSSSRCEFDLPSSTWPAMADGQQVGQVIRNLVLNAVQAMPQGGVVHVSTRNAPSDQQYSHGRVCVTVRDEGSGIPADLLDKIFLPFFTTREKGSGIGLSVAYSIISNHDGQIVVDSEVGKGTTVRFWLPAIPAAAPQPEVEEQMTGRGSGRILIMDDEEMVCRVSEAILRHAGYDTVCVPEGRLAIDSYVEQLRAGKPFDVVILDLTVPGGLGGKGAAAGILAADSSARILVSSGYSNDEVMSDPARFGLAGGIPKPFDATRLCDEVRRVLDTTRDRGRHK